MDIALTQSPGNPALASSAAAAVTQAERGVISSDFQTFLLMLTEQLKNQDPLNPLEATDFAVQLATFSGVEQQVRTNDLLRDLAGQMGAGSLAQYSGWIGMEAKTAAPVFFDGQPVLIDPQRATGATSSTLTVRDARGMIVGQAVLPPGTGPVEWVATDTSGAPMPTGLYSLSVENRNGDLVLPTTPVHSYARVTEVRASASGPEIVLAGGGVANPADVTALRNQ
jgi:flagellar basal-body rod modification protein FlgD